MAWPFGRKDRKEVEDDQTDERLRMMANVAIEQVPLPEEGIMTEEDAWTISPGPARVAMGGDSGPAPQYAAPAPAAPVVQNLDTSSLERLIANRLDMVEDVLRGVEHRLGEVPEGAAIGEGAGSHSGDTVVTADGRVISAGGSTARMKGEDSAPLLELYEAQALESNPFLHAPDVFMGESPASVGAPTIAALLLDHLTGMAAVSFIDKAIASGMLTPEEGHELNAIAQLAAPGEAQAALEDHLPDRELLTFSAMISTWRKGKKLQGVE